MSLELLDASFEDINDLIAVQFAAYSNPYHPYVALLYPGLGSQDSKKSQADAADRLRMSWGASPAERWKKVVDTKTGEIVAISRWQIFASNPFPDGPPYVEASWYPEGSRIREYCNFLMNDRLKRQAERCPMPNIWLNMMCTHPDHRRRGAASLMLQWATKLGDELNYEMFVEASIYGSEVYSKFGFIEKDKLDTRREDPEPDEEWKMLEKKYPFNATTWMWRPKQGVQDGKQGAL